MDRADATDSSEVNVKIREMVRRIVDGFDPERVILFGSHARGAGDRDSDVDLLVIMRVEGSKRDIRVRIRSKLRGIGVAKDVVAATPDEVERDREVIGSILRLALQEGRVLYDRGRP